jgi:hypothetical protein
MKNSLITGELGLAPGPGGCVAMERGTLIRVAFVASLCRFPQSDLCEIVFS